MNRVILQPQQIFSLRSALLAVLLVVRCVSTQAQMTTGSGAVALIPGSSTIQINSPGTYFLKGNLVVSGTSNNGIVITASNVTLDLDGHTISTASSAPYNPNVTGYGIYALNQTNVTVRNGSINGFRYAVSLDAMVGGQESYDGSTSNGHLIERLSVNGSGARGVCVLGGESAIRECRIVGTGGTSVASEIDSYGIYVNGPNNRVVECEVDHVALTAASNSASFGIYFGPASLNGIALLNRVSSLNYGLYYDTGATGKYEKNLAGVEVGRGYWGGTDAGKNIVDSNNNGIDDDWEMAFFGNLTHTSSSEQSPAGDGYTILQEYQLGRSPLDYYQGAAPGFQITAGKNQLGIPGSVLTQPLTTLVTAPGASTVQNNAPVVYQVTTGSLQIATTGAGPWGTSCAVRTNAFGQATVFCKILGTPPGSTVPSIQVTAGTAAPLSFNEFVLPPVVAGLYHTLALDQNGAVWSWGNNDSGQIGNGTVGYNGVNGDFSSAGQVTALSTGIVAVAAGNAHSIALRGNDGSVWTWGGNSYGQLGNNSTVQSSVPVQVLQASANSPIPLAGVIAIAAGSYHSLALKSDGTVWTWGYNSSGQLGNGVATNGTASNSLVAVQVLGANGAPSVLNGVQAIAAGDLHSLALKSDGTVWIWGTNGGFQLGNGNQNSTSIPLQVKNSGGTSYLVNIVAIAAGPSGNHSLALRADGAVFAWGEGNYGQLGNNFQNTGYPVQVYDVSGTTTLSGITAVAAGANHSLALKNDGTMYAWGNNNLGQLGINSTDPFRHIPVVVDSTNGAGTLGGVGAISAGGDHSVISVPYKGVTVFLGWGSNTYNETDGSAFVLASSYLFPVPAQLFADPDGDGLPNWQEYMIGSDPLNPDTNGDGILDGMEYNEGYDPSSLTTTPFTAASTRNVGVNALDYFSPTGGVAPAPNSGAPVITLTFPPGLTLQP